MVWNPRAWPLCSGFGTLLVVLNNYLTLRIARRATAVGGLYFSTLSETGRTFLNGNYGEWWRLMGFYSLAMIGIGFLLNAHVAHDAGVYAGLVVFINIEKVYRLNCVTHSPKVRGWLAHATLTLRRAALVASVTERRFPGTEAVAPTVPALVATVLSARQLSLLGHGEHP